tara:strand:- start:405 stop:1127 length:723 start_codon:yes stop_codon:yes gene_type:complete
MTKPTYMLNNVEALYPKLDQPYHFDRQGGKNKQGATVPCLATAQGATYQVNFKMTAAQAKDLFTCMAKAYEDSKEDSWPALTMPFTKTDDKMFEGKAKIPASFDGRPTTQPKQYDANNTPLDGEFQLTSGSTINVFVELVSYNGSMGNGVSLRLRAVQVIKYKEYSAASPFETQEGFTQSGFVEGTENLDTVFDTEEKTVVEEEAVVEVVEEPKVKVSKKKQNAPKPDVDLASLLDEFDD